MKEKIEAILNLFPEVTWDRWSGNMERCNVFGWIKRADENHDFVAVIIFQGLLITLLTSSARYSPEFAARLNCPHSPCSRVETDFQSVNSKKLPYG
jgi:hypothetical protein